LEWENTIRARWPWWRQAHCFERGCAKLGGMDLPVAEGALAQPTRAQIFNFLVERRAPAGTDDVAAHFGLHPNGVRRHLERLEEGGFVVRTRVRAGQGRPRDSWAISPDAHPGGMRPRAYSDLAGWLAQAIPDNRSRRTEVERVGREIGRELAGEGAEDPVEGFHQALSALGFQPTLDVKPDGSFACTLGNCPYRDSVRQNQPIVCGLHRGITAGLLAELAPDRSLAEFEPQDPDRAGCEIAVSAPGA